MPTGQTIINGALTTLGILEQGGTPSSSDSNDALVELNDLWDAWQIDDGLIYSVQSFQGTLAGATASYTIGSGATFNTTRPTKIFEAVIVATVGAGVNRRPIEIVNAQRYYAHGDLAAAATMPDELYPDYNVNSSGYATLYLWPVPSCPTATKLELEVGVPFTAWTLVGNAQIPFGYQDALNYVLAYRLIPRYGAAVAPSIVQSVTTMAQQAEARIRAANAVNRQIPPPPQMPAAAPAAGG